MTNSWTARKGSATGKSNLQQAAAWVPYLSFYIPMTIGSEVPA
jgi:hypothetical protein